MFPAISEDFIGRPLLSGMSPKQCGLWKNQIPKVNAGLLEMIAEINC